MDKFETYVGEVAAILNREIKMTDPIVNNLLAEFFEVELRSPQDAAEQIRNLEELERREREGFSLDIINRHGVRSTMHVPPSRKR